MKRFTSLLLALVFVLTSMPFAPITADTIAAPGEISITKTAVPVSNDSDNRDYNVTLTAQGTELVSKVPVDVVLVLDTSGSMQGNRLSAVKTAANNFATSVIDNNNMARVSIVSYAGNKGNDIYVAEDNITYNNDVPYNDARSVISLTNSKSALGLAINGLNANGGTNIEAGFYQARQELVNNGRNSAEKIVILMTDGEPTFAYTNANIQLTAGYYSGFWFWKTWHPGTYSNSDGITYGHGNAYSDEYKDKAIAEAFRIKNNHDAKIFTVGFTASANMTENIRKVLDPASTDKYHEQYFEASNESGINAAFEDISNQINAVAKNAKIVDIINEDFELVAGSAAGAEINGQKLTWNIGDIFDDEKSVTFKVRAKNNIYGAAYTNEAAYLYFDTPDANTFYDDDQFNNPDSAIVNEKRLTFEKPVVEVPPIAANDDFYSIKVGTTLEANTTALSVLANDPSNKMQSVTGWTTTSVVAEKTSEPTKGTISHFSANGTFTYVSNAGTSGNDTFTYNIVTTVQHGSGAVRTLRDSATVTINILPAYALAVVYEDKDNGAILTPVTNPNLGKAYAAGETYNVEVPAIADYDYVGPKTGSSLTGEMPANNIIVTLLYEKKTVNSTIVYYKNGQEIETVAGPSGKWGSSPKMSETQINKHLTEGYSVSGNPANYTITLDKVSANNVYRVYYTVNQYPVTVEYYYINNLTTPFDTTSLGNYAYGSEITSVSDALHTTGTYDRDTSSSTTLPFTVGSSGNTIKVVYVSKPVAADDIASTDANDPVTIDVLDNDSDPLGSSLSLTGIVTGPTDGSVVLNNDGNYVYTPDQDFTGTDSFVYGIENTYGKTDTATVTITIKPWQPITVHYIDEDTNVTLKDSFSESLRAGTSLASVAGLDIVQPDISGFTNKGIMDDVDIPSTMPEAPLEITYLYSRNSYDYTINYYFENSGELIESKTTNSAPYQSVIETVTDTTEVNLTVYDRFNVTGLPLTIGTDTTLNVINVYYAAKPQANPDAVAINPNEEIDINVLSNDTDIDGKLDELKVKSITQPASGNGTTSFDAATGIITYTPAANDSANTVTFQYTIEDKQGLTSTATVTVTIRPFYNLTVKYVELDNESNVIDVKDPIKMRFNDPFTVVPDVIPGYNLVGNQNLMGIMPEGNHEFIVYYSRANIGYTVRHYYENSDTEIPDSESAGLTAEFGSVLGADDIANYASLPDGYARFRVVFPNEATSLTISADADANIVEVYYAAEPVAVDDAVTINPNETVIIDVLENDIDIDDLGNELVIESIDTTSISDFEGTASISSSGKTITYEPVSDAEDKVISFNYTVRDAQNQTSTATVTVTIRSFYTLTVYYRETDNDSVELLTPVVNEEYVYEQSYEATAESITGYVPTGVVESRPVTGLGLTGNMPDNDLAIIVRYDRAEIAYTVEHYYEDDEFIGSDSLTALFEDEITATDVEDYAELPTGFARSRVEFPGDADSLVISADAENNVIRVYYASTTPPTIPTIEVTESEPPLAPPATPTPTPVPTIEVIETKPPLAEPTPTVPTIEVEQEELPKAGERAPLWPIGMAMLLMAGGLTFIMHRKDKTEQ